MVYCTEQAIATVMGSCGLTFVREQRVKIATHQSYMSLWCPGQGPAFLELVRIQIGWIGMNQKAALMSVLPR